jgi:hypothetical protein
MMKMGKMGKRRNLREIVIRMDYPENCAMSKKERDELMLFIDRILHFYTCSDHNVWLEVSDEFGKESVPLS